jgi:ribosomal-protein-alanine N-acetyltransferase
VSEGASGSEPGRPLETPRLSLRRWTEQDAGALHAAFGDPDSMRFWDSAPAGDVAETAERIRGSVAVSADWHAAFAVTLRETQEVVGMVNYHDRRALQRRLAIGWMIVPAWRGKGVARDAATALLRYCFTTLGANRIEARIEPANAPSLRVAARLGFQREGLMREWIVVEGTPRDMLMLALLRDDWKG